ncbi:MAG: carboxylesterase family protein, partial [Treponema sp.]|nr:carboxylesterase family protein [Treponema sp.]
YEFGTLDRSWRPKNEYDYALSDRMIAYWTNFMKSGNPNEAGLPDWKPCRQGDPFVMELA